MTFLILSVLFNAYIGIIFKYFDRYKVDASVAIVLNYWICIITGSLFLGNIPISITTISYNWSPYALIIGFLFILIFNLIAISSVKVGITITQAANKLSLAIPVIFSLILYNEELNVLKTVGIVIALIAVYLSTISDKSRQSKSAMVFIFPLLIFLGSGTIDTVNKFVEHNFLPVADTEMLNTYLISLFFVAACLGTLYLSIHLIKGNKKITTRNILGGILLGIPNYFSIYFILKALQYNGLSSSAIIPINNIAILTVVSLYGILILKEKLNLKNYIGLGLTVVAIILIYLAG